jgi:hypothetical protein
MNCADVHARLASFAYGDLAEAEANQIREHLKRCSACEQQRLAISEAQRLLDAVPAPAIAVNLPKLYRDVAADHRRQVRRWRIAAWAGLAAALLVAILLVSRLEVRVDANQVVLRWGAAPAMPELHEHPPAPHSPEPVVAAPQMSTAEIDQQLRMLRELVQAVSNDSDMRDERRQREITALQGRMHGLEQQMTQLRLATQREVAALSSAQIPEKQKGASQ